jgi:hypothetical protein
MLLCGAYFATAVTSGDVLIDPTWSPEVKGHAIAAEAARLDEGFGDSVAEVAMTLTDARGRTRVRTLTWETLEADDPQEGDRSLTVFQEPRDIAGTALLSHTQILRPDDQWLYLPSLKRVKRISSGNKSGPFVGSQFAYEDLLSDELHKFGYLWVRDEACGEHQCFVIERRPSYEGTGYRRQVVWLDQDELRPMRIDYFDLDDRLEKTLTFSDYRRYRNRHWRAHALQMHNWQSGDATILEFREFRFQTGLTELDFDASALRRLR